MPVNPHKTVIVRFTKKFKLRPPNFLAVSITFSNNENKSNSIQMEEVFHKAKMSLLTCRHIVERGL